MPAQQPRSGPSFQPRNFCVNPKSFGRSLDAEWRVPNRSNRALFDAAQLQHRFAWQVIQQLGARGWSRKDLAAALDVDYQRLTQDANLTVAEAMERATILDEALHRWYMGPDLEAKAAAIIGAGGSVRAT